VKAKGECPIIEEPLYFMTDDDFTKGLNQTTVTGEPYESVVQPNHIEAVITKLETGENNHKEIWKYARYFDNPQFSDDGKVNSTQDEYELYNLTKNPLKERNLANEAFATEESRTIQQLLEKLLE
jgi:hypothetical protein